MIFYLCTGEDPNCAHTSCYLSGGECKHTSKHECAKNQGLDPKKNPERFEVESFNINNSETVTYYWEREKEAESDGPIQDV